MGVVEFIGKGRGRRGGEGREKGEEREKGRKSRGRNNTNYLSV